MGWGHWGVLTADLDTASHSAVGITQCSGCSGHHTVQWASHSAVDITQCSGCSGHHTVQWVYHKDLDVRSCVVIIITYINKSKSHNNIMVMIR